MTVKLEAHIQIMKEKFIKEIEALKKIDKYVKVVNQIKTESIINKQAHTAEHASGIEGS